MPLKLLSFLLRSSSIAEIDANFSMLARSSNALGRKRRATKFIQDEWAQYTAFVMYRFSNGFLATVS